MELVIDRKYWLRASGSDNGQLCTRDRKCMCAMGWYMNQILHIPKDKLRSKGNWMEIKDKRITLSDEWMLGDLWDNVVDTNDDDGINDTHREKRIKQLFQNFDIKVKFIGKGNPVK